MQESIGSARENIYSTSTAGTMFSSTSTSLPQTGSSADTPPMMTTLSSLGRSASSYPLSRVSQITQHFHKCPIFTHFIFRVKYPYNFMFRKTTILGTPTRLNFFGTSFTYNGGRSPCRITISSGRCIISTRWYSCWPLHVLLYVFTKLLNYSSNIFFCDRHFGILPNCFTPKPK